MWGKCKNVIAHPENSCHFQRSRSFEVKFTDNVPLTTTNVPTKFRWNKPKRFGEKCKKRFQTLKMAVISQGQGHLKSNSWTRCPLPLAMSLPSLVSITKIHLEKSAKICFQTLKMATISQGQDRLRSNSRTRCPLPMPTNVATKFCANNQNRLGEKCKSVSFLFKMAAI